MKRLSFCVIMVFAIFLIAYSGDWKDHKGAITDEGTTYYWFDTPKFTNGIAIYFDVTSTPTSSVFLDTSWVTLWTKYQNVSNEDDVIPNVDSVTAILSAKDDTCQTLIFFDADSLQVGPNAKYKWGPKMAFKFVVRDTITEADTLFDTPLYWRATVGGF